MKRRSFISTSAAAAVLVMFRKQLSFAKGEPAVKLEPLLAPFAGANGGMPPFDKIKVTDFKPALMKAMDLHRAELAAITDSKDAPTFDNTIVAYEDSGRPLGRVSNIMGVYTSTMNGKDMQEVEKEMSPVLAAYSDEVTQNEK